MKTQHVILTVSLLLVCLITAAKGNETSLMSGQSLTELGQYTIHASANALKIGNEALKTYELNYDNGASPILIGVKKTKKNCINFIVHANNFEVEYVCKKHVFGVKRINKEYQTVDSKVIDDMMDNLDFYTQRVISQNPKTEEELLGLIACYFPSLIKEVNLAKLGSVQQKLLTSGS